MQGCHKPSIYKNWSICKAVKSNKTRSTCIVLQDITTGGNWVKRTAAFSVLFFTDACESTAQKTKNRRALFRAPTWAGTLVHVCFLKVSPQIENHIVKWLLKSFHLKMQHFSFMYHLLYGNYTSKAISPPQKEL